MPYHTPVLLQACLDGLEINPSGVYVDATFGGGGHSKAILEKLDDGKLVGFDKDEDAEKNAPTDERFIFINHDFRHLKRFLRLHGIKQVDGILADLGISSHQIDTADRGFSIRFDADLDMRMDKTQALSAQQIVNDFEEEEVVKIFSEYGEIRNSKQLANELLIARAAAPILTTEQLKLAVEPAVRGNPNRYFAQLFQAIRITVNDEMNGLKEFIEQSEEALKPGGRLAVISYHSLEDRPVKNFIKNGSFDGELKKDFYGVPQRIFKAINKKPILPTQDEIKQNPRARSAKLRVAEKL